MVATRGQKRKQSDGEKKEEDKVPTPSGSVKNKTKNAENNNMMDVDEVKPVENEQEQLLLADVLNHCRIIEKAVSIREYRSMGRIVRELNTIRKKITPSVLKTVVATGRIEKTSQKTSCEFLKEIHCQTAKSNIFSS